MKPTGPRLLGALVALAALSISGQASATPGNGIRLGGTDGRLHPYFELESRWDSNAQFQTTGQSGLVMHLRPGFSIASPGDLLAIDGDARLDWAQYLTGEDTSKLSRLFADVSLGVGLNRKGTLGFELKDDFQRSTTTASLTFGSAVISNRNNLDLSIPWRPGGGALAVTALGSWKLETFAPYSDCLDITDASCSTQELKDLGYNDLRGGIEAKWRFLPRTAAVVDASYSVRMPNSTTASRQVTGWRADAGVQGLISAHIAATLKGGYGSASGGGGLGTWLATGELEWLPTVTTSARLGYVHDWGTDPGTPFALYGTHRFYVMGNMLLAGRLTAGLKGQLESLSFHSSSGSNLIYRLEPTLDYALARWGTLGLGYTLSHRKADVPNVPAGYAYDFTKQELWLKFRFTY